MTDQKTAIDWFRLRCKCEPPQVLEALRPMFGSVGSLLNLQHLPRGILGFQQGATIRVGDMPVGRLDYGGESQQGWVRTDLSGTGCGWVQDWTAVDSVEQLPHAQLRRLDIALTTWKGEIGHDRVVEAHGAGRFITRGRPPAMRQIISTDPQAGRTCEIGTRERSDKFMRCYEKGFEMAKRSPGVQIASIDGHPVADIYRCEVEFKAVQSDIPWEVIERRDQYFAGAYPFCADVLPGVECDILKRRPEREPQLDLAVALENIRIQYGPTLYTALHAYHGDIGAVWEKILGDRHNQTLVEAGCLMVDHA
jgi:DNA relaxase NicK